MELPDDLQRVAFAAYLAGRDAEAVDLLVRAHGGFLAQREPVQAARTAFWIGFVLTNRGERAQAAGWFARGRRLLEGEPESTEHGYLLLPAGLEQVGQRDFAAAAATFDAAARIGEAHGDADLVQFARHARGRALMGLGRTMEGLTLLDEVMVAVTSGELSPPLAGTIYCSVISACFDILDLRRAQEWTDALNRWCTAHPDAAAYRGQCLIHRAEIMQLHGLWADAADEARRACEQVSPQPPNAIAGAAHYQLAELHRLRGAFPEAEEQYRLAAECGRTAQPGLALLRLAQGRVDSARAAIARAVDDTGSSRSRASLLAAYVEIQIAGGDVAAARAACDQLAALAQATDTAFTRAIALHARSAVLLADRRPEEALASLGEARAIWRDLQVPYEAARATAAIARACCELGDADGARMEAAAANHAFRQLGAADVCTLTTTSEPLTGACQLTSRETQVLKLLATGQTNRAIADALRISEKTVARHVSNIFVKLDVSSRSAATAYAFTHQLI